jgi:hypothetical protein
LGALWEALRIAKEEVELVVVAIRVHQITPRWGRRNRGMEVVGGILNWGERKRWRRSLRYSARCCKTLARCPSSPSVWFRLSVCSVSRENFRCCQLSVPRMSFTVADSRLQRRPILSPCSMIMIRDHRAASQRSGFPRSGSPRSNHGAQICKGHRLRCGWCELFPKKMRKFHRLLMPLMAF